MLTQLGAVLKYGPRGPHPGQPVGPDIEASIEQLADGNPDLIAGKQAETTKEGTDFPADSIDRWLREHPGVDVERVPADMVMASGSGLDPDITLSNALWQLQRVASAWARETGADEKKLHGQIEQLLREMSHAPLGGLAGCGLVNVLQVNLALRDRFRDTVRTE